MGELGGGIIHVLINQNRDIVYKVINYYTRHIENQLQPSTLNVSPLTQMEELHLGI